MNFLQFNLPDKVIANQKPMANIQDRLSNNAPGRFYVDESCIDCDLCRSNVPRFFTRDDSTGYSYVYRQPETPEEIIAAQEAMDECPSESIGNDGAQTPVAI